MIERDSLELLDLAGVGVGALSLLERRESLFVVDLDANLLRRSGAVRHGPSELFTREDFALDALGHTTTA